MDFYAGAAVPVCVRNRTRRPPVFVVKTDPVAEPFNAADVTEVEQRDLGHRLRARYTALARQRHQLRVPKCGRVAGAAVVLDLELNPRLLRWHESFVGEIDQILDGQ
jgi:hypothetical protein